MAQVQDPDPAKAWLHWALHWATLSDGAHRAWLKDTKKENRAVQITITNGLKNAKVYWRQLHKHYGLMTWLKNLGNKFNDENTATTALEKMKATTLREACWVKRRSLMGWTWSLLSGKDFRNHII